MISSVCALLLVSLFVFSAPAYAQQDIELSEQERAWLAQHPVIRVANEMDWPPFDFVDDKGQASGFSIEHFTLVANKLGLGVEWVNGYSWQQLLEMGRLDQVDAFPAIIFNDERAEFLHFSQPYVENVVGYFVRDDISAISINQPQELAQYRLALVKGFDNHRTILKLLPDAVHVEVNSVLEGLKAVMTGEADLLIADTAVGNYLIKKHLLRGVQVAGGVKLPELFESSKIRIAARDDYPELISILQKGMAAVSEEELQALRNHWLELPSQPLLTKERLIILAVIAVVMALLFASITIWGLRRQRNQLIHEMQAQTRSLNESERRLALALQGGGMVAWDLNLQTGAVVLGQDWWPMVGQEQSTGLPTREDWLSYVYSGDKAKVLEAETACRQGQSRYEVEYRVRDDNGHRRWHLAIGAGVEPDSAGQACRVVGVIQDITVRKRMERMKDEFVSTVSHELRTPLTSIKGSLGLMVGGAVGGLSDQARDMLQIAYDNSDRLLLLINDLLDVEKIQAGKLELNKQRIQLTDLLARAVEMNQGFADKFSVTIRCEVATLPELSVVADEARLLQVLSNLLSNAIKFSPPDGLVDLSVTLRDNVLRISITDQGPGIPKDFQAQIFKPFSQADASDSRQRGGTGLGLAISKRLMEMHDGRIGFDSAPGEGACFYIELPLDE